MINPAQLIRKRIGYAQVVRIPEPVQVVRFWFPDDYFIYKQRFLLFTNKDFWIVLYVSDAISS
jgi:hypothetical protein